MPEANIKNNGAVAGGGDDTDAFRAAVNAAGDGGTVVVPAGYWHINGQVQLRPGQTVRGETVIKSDGKELCWSENDSRIFSAAQHVFRTASNNTIDKLTIDGHALWAENVKGLTVSGCNLFAMHVRHPTNKTLIELAGRFDGVTVKDSVIGSDPGLTTSVWSSGGTNLLFYRVWFDGCQHGMHPTGYPLNRCEGFLWEQCYFGRIRTCALEYQGYGKNIRMKSCWFEKPRLSPTYAQNTYCLGWSMPGTETEGFVAEDCVGIAPERPDGTGVRYGFELSETIGVGFTLTGCAMFGYNWCVAVTNNNARGKIVDNHFEGALFGPHRPEWTNYNSKGGKVQIANNVNPELGKRLLARGRPFPFKGFSVTQPPLDPDPDPDPDPQPGPDPRDARIAELEQQRAQDQATIAEKDRRLNNAKAAGENVLKAVNGQ